MPWDVWIFKGDLDTLKWPNYGGPGDEYPANLSEFLIGDYFEDSPDSSKPYRPHYRMWSMETGNDCYSWLIGDGIENVATDNFKEAYDSKRPAWWEWNEDDVGYVYQRQDGEALRWHKTMCTMWNYLQGYWKGQFMSKGCHRRNFQMIPAECPKCDQDLVDNLEDNLPGIGSHFRRSLEYKFVRYLNKGNTPMFTAIAYVLSDATHGYNSGVRQHAIWNILEGYSQGDRGLSEIALNYQEFYEHMCSPDGSNDAYAKNMEVYAKYAEPQKVEKSDKKVSSIGESDYDTDFYEIPNLGAKYRFDDGDGDGVYDNPYQIILGPYNIDFTYDDKCCDKYSSEDGLHIFNSVENVWVANQDGKDITRLGGSFRILRSPGGEEYKKITRINDPAYDPLMCDGAEVWGFYSKTDFYIEVNRGTMKPEDFLAAYVQIDFQYLADCEGESVGASLSEYEGIKWLWWWNMELDPYKWSYSATGEYTEDTTDMCTAEDCGKHHHSEWLPWSQSQSGLSPASRYIMDRDSVGEAERLMLQDGHFNRKYNHYSIQFVKKWDKRGKPDIKLYKYDAETNEPLVGATFDIEITVIGVDEYAYSKHNQKLYFTETTDQYGCIRITTRRLNELGVCLPLMAAGTTIEVKVTEKIAPPGYEKLTGTISGSFSVDKGFIQGASGGTVENNNFVMKLKDSRKPGGGSPIIQIAKVDKGNGLIDASFKIHVKYQAGHADSEGNITYTGNLVDKSYNYIYGQTTDGVLNLTVEDFANMPGNEDGGLDIASFTGKVILDIVEIKTQNGYTFKTESKDITLVYINGVLQEYTEYTDEDVIIQYWTDTIIEDIYNWATSNGQNSGNLTPAMVQYLEKWTQEQIGKHQMDEASGERKELKYEDVLGWLAEFVSSDENEGQRKEIVDHATKVTTEGGNKVVQVVIENDTGFTIPEIPDVPENPDDEEWLLRIAGKVFLDKNELKEDASDANGKYDPGELTLSGVEVTLYYGNGQPVDKFYYSNNETKTWANPTYTDSQGEYEFGGLYPNSTYYVGFRYNGMEYETTVSPKAEYNSADWNVTSKGSELTSKRQSINNMYKTITPETYAYSYQEIESLYEEAALLAIIDTRNINNQKPPKNGFTGYNGQPIEHYYDIVESNHGEDPDIKNKIAFMKASLISAYAGDNSVKGGISSETSNGVYPKKGINDTAHSPNYQINIDTADENVNDWDVLEQRDYIYPGQLNIHLGLVERPEVNLSLESDIVDTTVSMNRYDTKYNYYTKQETYNQYIYEEDYNYSVKDDSGMHKRYDANAQTEGNIAYYTEDEMEFYMTYEIVVKSSKNIPTTLNQIVDYYNPDFEYAPEGGIYKTSKGNDIEALSATFNGQPQAVSVSESGMTGDAYSENTGAAGYKALFFNFGGGIKFEDPSQELVIRIVFRMKKNPSEILFNHIGIKKEEEELQGDNKYSKTWLIGNYAEINGYSTENSYLDMNSRPGNFKIQEFEKAKNEYAQALYELDAAIVGGGDLETASRKATLTLGKLLDAREDDAWKVCLALANSGYVREISGNIWEAVNGNIKSSLDLQNGGEKPTYSEDANLALGGIKVELVELLKGEDNEEGANQIVRAVTTTDDDGSYNFQSYIAGDYTVRFIYGDYSGDTIYSKVSTNTAGDKLPVNGQYYQSTKSNSDTDNDQYWYRDKDVNEEDKKLTDIDTVRYSDAYDDAYSRLTQMNARIENAENSNSIEYDYDGVLEVESARHTDPIYAYTSTMELEVEYIRPEVTGNTVNTDFPYDIQKVDFGVTPRAYNDVNIKKYVSNVKLYLQDGNKIVDANFDESGHQTGSNIVTDVLSSNGYLDGLIDIYYNDLLLQGATIELTYTIKVTNDSLHNGGVYDTIKYIKQGGKTIAVAYYDENVEELVAYESGDDIGQTITYHNAEDSSEYGTACLAGENHEDSKNPVERLKKYARISGFNVGRAEIIQSRATNIVDYPVTPLDFNKTNYLKEQVNGYWEDTNPSEFVSSRELYNAQDGSTKLLDSYSHILRATDDSPLYRWLNPGEEVTDEIVLSAVLGTTASGANEFEFSNLIELTRLENSAGKVIDMEGYDITGESERETSVVRPLQQVDGANPSKTPSIGTGKSPTIIITVPQGLTLIEDTIESNLGIVLVGLVILSIGLVLIKKFVVVPKKEE